MLQKDKNKNKNDIKDISAEEYQKMLDSIFDNAEKEEKSGEEENRKAPALTPNEKNWRHAEFKDLTEEYSSEKLSSEAVDEKLLLALGYLTQTEDEDMLDKTVGVKEPVFGLNKEFSDVREIPTIKSRFKKEKKNLVIRLIATLALSFLIFVYSFASSLLKDKISFFDTSVFFLPNMFVLLQLLIIAAAFSAKDLFKGLVKTLILRPNIYSPPALLILSLFVFEFLFAFTAKNTANFNFAMYTLPASLSLLLPIISDIMRVRVQEKTFLRINAHETDGKDVFHLSQTEEGIFLKKNGKDIDFYKKTRMQHTDPKVMNFVLIPGFALSLIAGLYTFFVSKDAGSLFTMASACLCIILPSAEIMNYFPFFFASEFVLDQKKASIIGRSSISSLAECNCITVNDTDIFEKRTDKKSAKNGLTTRMTVELYNLDLFFDFFYYGACILRNEKSALANLFLTNAEQIDFSDEINIISKTDDGISGTVDKKILIQMGNATYMNECGIVVPEDGTKELEEGVSSPSFVLYMAKNGTLISKSKIFYVENNDFSDMAEKIRKSGMILKILSSDFIVTKELIKKTFSLKDDDFVLVKTEKNPSTKGKRFSLAVCEDSPAPLLSMGRLCASVLSAERAVYISSIFSAIFASLVAIALTFFSFTMISPYIVILFNIIMLLPSALVAAVKLSHFLSTKQ